MKITINVPNPCHEDWNAMSRREQGRHCAQCDHVVADLTRATDQELLALFTSDAKPKCARFDPRQLDRMIGVTEPMRTSNALPIAAFTTLAAVASGCERITPADTHSLGEPAIPQPVPQATTGITMAIPMLGSPIACMPFNGDTVATVTAVDPPLTLAAGAPEITIEVVGEVAALPVLKMPMIEFCGSLVDDRTNEPMPFVPVAVRDHNTRAVTDERGEFRLSLPARVASDLVVVQFNLPGYESLTKEVWPPGAGTPEVPIPERIPEIPVSGPIEGEAAVINGFVTEVPVGQLLPGTVVRIKDSWVAVRCDEDGYFGLRVPVEWRGREITLEFEHADAGTMSLPVLTTRLPLELPVKFKGVPRPATATRPTDCRDLGALRLHPERECTSHVVGGLVLRTIHPKPTVWQRITSPFRKSGR